MEFPTLQSETFNGETKKIFELSKGTPVRTGKQACGGLGTK